MSLNFLVFEGALSQVVHQLVLAVWGLGVR